MFWVGKMSLSTFEMVPTLLVASFFSIVQDNSFISIASLYDDRYVIFIGHSPCGICGS